MESHIKLEKTNPADKANIFSKAFLLWSVGLFRTGYKRDLNPSDVYRPRQVDKSDRLGDDLEQAWDDEVNRAQEADEKPSLSKAIVKVFWLRYAVWGVWLALTIIIMKPLVPVTLANFVSYFSGERTDEAYVSVHINNFLMNFLSLFSMIVMHHAGLGQMAIGMQVRIACCSLMYRKVLKLDRLGMSNTASGQVVNLMSNDVQRFDTAPVFLHYIWLMPFVVVVVTYLIWQHIGVATLSALVVILLQSLLVQGYLSALQTKYRHLIAKKTDERVKFMSELVSGVQVIKMYAWEKPFEKIVELLRRNEMRLITRTTMIRGFSIALMVFTERFILFTALVTFVVLGGVIRADIAFSMVQYFNLLQLICSIFVPLALTALGEARVSVKRIEEFMLLDEQRVPKHVEAADMKVITASPWSAPTELVLQKASAAWLPDPIVDTLRNINITVPYGSFLGIAGPVGAGKSSILQILLGELPLTAGSLDLGGARLSYAAQEPWLFVASVRQNILFGQPFDKEKYKKVTKACALLRDFELLPKGDLTMVGERGISLSGGQRARIGLARAVYRDADVYLLDDPLSAVDTHVGKHLIRECICGYLRKKTRILVTHQLHHLKDADNIAILRNGEVEVQGTFDEVSKNPLFSELLHEEEQEEQEQDPHMIKVLETLQSRRGSTQIQPTDFRMRSISVTSYVSVLTTVNSVIEEENFERPDEEQELLEKGNVSASVYGKYMTVGGGWLLLSSTLLAIIFAQLITSMGDLWLGFWMNQVEAAILINQTILAKSNNLLNAFDINFTTPMPLDTVTNIMNENLTDSTTPLTVMGAYINTMSAIQNLTTDNGTATDSAGFVFIDNNFFIYIWMVFILACVIFTTVRSLMFLWVCMRSSVALHNSMFTNIMQATMRFFDTNPSGRILNRFSKDMGILDEFLPRMYIESIQSIMVTLGILIMVAIVSPISLVTTGVCSIFMYLLTIVYIKTAQQIKRIEGTMRSPVFSHVTSTMAGLSTVRVCRAQQMLRVQFDQHQDIHTGAWYMTIVTNIAFSIWLTVISGVYVAVLSYTFLFMDDGHTQSGNVGLAISQGLILVGLVQHGIKIVTDTISQTISAERVMQYTRLPQESPLYSLPSQRPSADWPNRGRIEFRNLYLRYVEGGEPVLRNLNVVIESGWKVGVVGRTGAGKSSLISALFRLAVVDGDVIIDNVDTSKIGLRDLRAKLSIIPQEPVLFSASLRYNLDPFSKNTDADIWNALSDVELKEAIQSLSQPVSERGTNFSAGQRQLLCLARAALNNNQVLVLDEATANVDPKTDMVIQKTIRSRFAACTVITVAHRLNTVADSDRVLVMDSGQVVQFAHPHELLLDTEGTFAKMVEQLGPAAGHGIKEVAKQAYEKHLRYIDAD